MLIVLASTTGAHNADIGAPFRMETACSLAPPARRARRARRRLARQLCQQRGSAV